MNESLELKRFLGSSVDDSTIVSCCNIFDCDFDKLFLGKRIRVFPRRFRRYLNDSILIGAYKDTLVGYIIYEVITADTVWIKQIIVKKEYRNQGVATRMVKELLPYREIGLITNNPIMLHLIQKLGYKYVNAHDKCGGYEYCSLFNKQALKEILILYGVNSIQCNNNTFLVDTHLVNIQPIRDKLSFNPLPQLLEGKEYVCLFKR